MTRRKARAVALASVAALLVGCGATTGVESDTAARSMGRSTDLTWQGTDTAPSDLAESETENLAAKASAPIPTSPPQLPKPRVAVFGDSTALMTSFGLAQWLETTGSGTYVSGRVDLGCGIVRQGIRRDQLGQGPNNPICQHWDRHWLEMLEQSRPDIVVVQVGPWDVIDHLLDGDTVWRAPGDPVYDAELQREMLAVVDLFASHHAHVAWLTLPRQRVEVGQAPGSETAPGTDPARSRRFNELLAELPTLRPGAVTILDLAAWLAEPGRDEAIRPDGIHVTFETTNVQAELWLGSAVIAAYESAWYAAHDLSASG